MLFCLPCFKGPIYLRGPLNTGKTASFTSTAITKAIISDNKCELGKLFEKVKEKTNTSYKLKYFIFGKFWKHYFMNSSLTICEKTVHCEDCHNNTLFDMPTGSI